MTSLWIVVACARRPVSSIVRLTPKGWHRRIHKTVGVVQAVSTVLAEQKRPVEVNEARLLCDQYCRRHCQRCGDHAPDHDCEISLLSLGDNSECFGQSA